jgi:MFS family permease
MRGQSIGIISGVVGAVAAVAIALFLGVDHRAVPTWLRIDFLTKDPVVLSQSFLVTLLLAVISIKIVQYQANQNTTTISDEKKNDAPKTATPPSSFIASKPVSVRQLQRKFLSVFWLIRVAFWMAGPYFYVALASKTLTGNKPMPVHIISQVSLTGYAAIALLGPMAAKIAEVYGKRVATMVGVLFYGLGSFAMTSDSLPVLFVGRAISGVGQSIISNAPESWFVSETKQTDRDPKGVYLSETFGLAYSLDSVVAIVAGQLAQLAASHRGPTGPFLFSPFFLLLGGVVVLLFWSEESTAAATTTTTTTATDCGKTKHSIQETVRVIFADPKIVCLGIVQSIFEAAMYIFVLSWAPVMIETIHVCFGESVATPFGLVFSCFMAASMLGSTVFSVLLSQTNVRLELAVSILMAAASLSLVSSLWPNANLHEDKVAGTAATTAVLKLFLSYLGFEACVGMYFPSIGTLRARILPDSHRSVIMTLFAVPLNAMVVTVFLLLEKLGHRGGIAVAAAALGLATIAMLVLDRIQQQEERALEERRRQTRAKFRRVVHDEMMLHYACRQFARVIGGSGQVYTRDGDFDLRSSRSSFGVDFPRG